VTEARNDGSLNEIPIAKIRPNPFQPRNVFDESALEELKQSLATSGLLQPVVVRPTNNGYELIAGERRLRAAQQLRWNSIGAVVRDVDDKTLLTLALVENLQRDALSPIDEALGYERLIDQFEVSQAEVGNLVGRNRSTVTNALRLLRLPDEIQDLVHTKQISTGHARALLQVSDVGAMKQLADRAVKEALSVRDVEAAARGGTVPKRRPRKTNGESRVSDPEVRRVEDTLRRRLGTDVFVSKRSKHSGRITVNFYSNEDLARVLELMLGRPFEG
jgi:ParB family chromosome partitioning protein